MSKKHTYHVEVESYGRWRPLGWTESCDFIEGYVTAMGETPGPRLAYRAVRDDGRVMADTPARADVSIGQVAGFPTAEQYQAAGDRAHEQARQIRERAKR